MTVVGSRVIVYVLLMLVVVVFVRVVGFVCVKVSTRMSRSGCLFGLVTRFVIDSCGVASMS